MAIHMSDDPAGQMSWQIAVEQSESSTRQRKTTSKIFYVGVHAQACAI